MMSKYQGNQVVTDELEEEVKKLQEERMNASKSAEEAEGDPEIEKALNATQDESLDDKQREWAKRYADLRRHEQQKLQEFKDKEKQFQEELKALKEAQVSFPTNQEDLKEWSEKHPEVSDIVKTIAIQEAGKAKEEAKAELQKEIEELQAQNSKLQSERAVAKVKSVHPDRDELNDSPEFHDWVESKGDFAQKIYTSLDPQVTIDVITLYKAEKGLLTAKEDKPQRGRPRKVKDEAAAAATVVTKSTNSGPDSSSSEKKTWKESEIASLKAEDMVKHYEDIKLAQREGRFVYDMSQQG